VCPIEIPTDLHRDIEAWLEAAAGAGVELRPKDPLFVEVRRGGHVPGRHPISGQSVYDIVKRRLKAMGKDGLGPHSLRATFVTLALEGGAPLHLVQRAAGHADPRTTEQYWRRKNDLDDAAVDYVRL
jgi:integrase